MFMLRESISIVPVGPTEKQSTLIGCSARNRSVSSKILDLLSRATGHFAFGAGDGLADGTGLGEHMSPPLIETQEKVPVSHTKKCAS